MKRTRTKYFVFALFMLVIILLSTVFHFHVHFEDALAQSPALDYEVEISIWRIVFEPIFGPLLYLNRSFYAIEEVPLTLFWVLIFYIILSLEKVFKEKPTRKRDVFTKLADLPVVIGICFTVFVVIFFVPLPNNSIVNTSEDRVLVTTHAHTEFSHDGLISQKKMWEWQKRNGFDAFFITDHANHKKSLQFSREQKNGKFPVKPLVLVGQEFSGTNHMSLLGLNGAFETKGLSDKEVIDSVHRYGGAVIINHWFDGKGKRKEVYAALGADGFEIENAGKDFYYDRDVFGRLRKFCEENRLIMIGGLDFHGYGRVCSLYNAFEIPDWDVLGSDDKEQAIINILKNGPQEKIKVLLYKDRPFYTNSKLLFRPFSTAVNYFRTLNLVQVLSWFFWLLLFQLLAFRAAKFVILRNNGNLLLALTSAIFLMVLGAKYYFKGKSISDYNEIYAEYSLLLGPIGLGLLLYVVVVGYFRYFSKHNRKRASVRNSTHNDR